MRKLTIAYIISFLLILFFDYPIHSEDLPSIVKMVKPCVAIILTYDEEGDTLNLGSGFFVSEGGDIITNYHVIDNACSGEVITVENKRYPIKQILAEDIEVDIALISADIPINEIHPLQISSTLPDEGETIVVIGNPLGLLQTVTKGIVSAIRDLPGFGKIIQIDAAISPGSSGSPVLNLEGEVVGIATLTIIGGQNLNFAIPGSRIKMLDTENAQDFAKWKIRKKTSHGSAWDIFLTGYDYLWVEDYENAIRYFQQAIRLENDFAEAHFGLGYCYSELGRLNESMVEYKRVIKIDSEHENAHYNLGLIYFDLKRFQNSFEAFKKVIEINPQNSNAYVQISRCCHELGRHNQSIQYLKRGIERNPKEDMLYTELGLEYYFLENYEDALKVLKESIRLNPNCAPAHAMFGSAYQALHQYNNAIIHYEKAIQLEPSSDAEIYYVLGQDYEYQNRYLEAIKVYTQATLIDSNYLEPYYGLYRIYSELEKYEKAAFCLENAIRINPRYENALVKLGMLYSILGKDNDAKTILIQTIALYPKNASAHFFLGGAYYFLDDKASAYKEYGILKTLDPEKAEELLKLILK